MRQKAHKPLKKRWGVVVGLVLLVGLSGYCYLLTRQRLPVGSGPAGPPVASAPFAETWSEEPVVVVGLGDSLTSGYGAPPGGRYFDLLLRNDPVACPDMQGRDLTSVYPAIRGCNYAVRASPSAQHLAKQVAGTMQRFRRQVRGIVVITSGGKDVLRNYGTAPPEDGAMYGCGHDHARMWRPRFEQRLTEIIDGVNAKLPGGCEIFLANLYDPTDGVGDLEHAHVPLPRWPDYLRVLALWNQVIAERCEAYPNVHLVDLHRLFLGHGIHCTDPSNPHYRPDDPHYWYAENLEDPNARGHDAIRRAFLLQMVRVLATRKPGRGNAPAE